ncbi:MAG: hypothetical protein S0880_32325 [Actinomycetota bacterium]|nr:hypothetical protein [Actinomycetota bacterium]
MSGRKLWSVTACVGVLAAVVLQGSVGAQEDPDAPGPGEDGAVEVEPSGLFVEPDPDMLHVRDPEAPDEADSPRGSYGDLVDGVMIEGFGTGDDEVATVHISGTLGVPAGTPADEDDGSIPTTDPDDIDGVATEDDGSIEVANRAEPEPGSIVRWGGVLGDNTDADTVADVDVFALGALEEWMDILVETDTSGVDDPVDTMVVVFDEAGEVIASNDDGVGIGTDSRVAVAVPRDGEYFAAVVACCRFPDDPFDPTSAGPPGETGEYAVELGAYVSWLPRPSVRGDTDVFVVELAAGDVLAGGFSGAAGLVYVHEPNGPGLLSRSNVSALYPAASPLRHTGDIGIEHVVAYDGPVVVAVTDGAGDYEGELRVVRSPAENEGTVPQVVYLDTDGADVDLSTLVPKAQSPAGLAPLSASLAGWGLEPDDEEIVVDAMVERVEAIFERWGPEGASLIEVRRSDRDPDPWGEPDVSRVVLGGSPTPPGLVATGVAESVDLGNVDREETAVVLLDLLSAPTGIESINTIPLAPGASKAELTGATLGTLATQEIGHLLGLWDTDTVHEVLDSVMDRGELGEMIGIGDDGVWGTEDDDVPGFNLDYYAAHGPYWGGIQDERARLAAALGWFGPDRGEAVESGEAAESGEAVDPVESDEPVVRDWTGAG